MDLFFKLEAKYDKMRVIASILILFFAFSPAFAQQSIQEQKDSLATLLPNADHDTTRVLIMNSIARLFLDNQADSAIHYFNAAQKLAAKIGFERGLAKIYINKASAFYDLGKLDSTISLCNEALSICERLQLGMESVAALNTLANTWNHRGNRRLALENFEKCLELMQTVQVPDHFPIVINDNISIIYLDLKLFTKAVETSRRTLELALGIQDESSVGTAYQHLGTAFKGLGQLDSATFYLQKAVDIGRKIEFVRLLTSSLSTLAHVYSDLGDIKKAEDLYRQALQIALQEKDSEGMVYNYHGLGLIGIEKGNFKEAEKFTKLALDQALLMKFSSYLPELYLTLSDIEVAKGNWEKHSEYRRLYHTMRDTIANNALIQATQELEIKYQTKIKEQEILQLKQQQEIQALQLIRRKNLLLAALGLSILSLALGFIAWRNMQNRKRIMTQESQLHQQKIKELEQEKQLSVADAVLQGQEEERVRLAQDLHDGLGGMLSGIKQSLFAMRGNQFLSETAALSLGQVITNLDQSISELRHIARNMMPEALVRYGLDEALRDYCDHIVLPGKLEVHYQSFNMDSRLAQQTEVILFRVAQELLNNAVKHAEASHILVQLLRDGPRVNLTIEDNGKGFNPEKLKSAKGIGWMNIESRVNYLNGNIDLRSKPGQGASVSVEVKV